MTDNFFVILLEFRFWKQKKAVASLLHNSWKISDIEMNELKFCVADKHHISEKNICKK